MAAVVAIVGRPNVGKSTLFNRLVGRKLALVDDTPGVTRDRRTGEGRVGNTMVTFVDTAGFEDSSGEGLTARMREQTLKAVTDADLALFMIDARAGVTPLDAHFARVLRRVRTPVLAVANKCEGRAGDSGLAEAHGLGFGDPLPISAEHGQGIVDLQRAMQERFEADLDAAESPTERSPSEAEHQDADEPPSLAVVGRPNVGKSTLVNRLIADERLLTGPEPGITRDAISVPWVYRGRPIKLIDTAGLRRKSRVDDRLERLSVGDTLRAVRYADVAMLVLDGDAILDKQDLAIARHVIEEGRGLVIAVNKWDAVDDRQAALGRLSDRLATSLPQVKGVPTIPVSGKTGSNLDKLMSAVFEIHELWNRRLSTAALNRWLEEAVARHTPPLVQGRRLKIRYMTQIKARPPTFALWVNKVDALPESYERYLINLLRQTFGLPGVPIRFVLRKGKNPYAKT